MQYNINMQIRRALKFKYLDTIIPERRARTLEEIDEHENQCQSQRTRKGPTGAKNSNIETPEKK